MAKNKKRLDQILVDMDCFFDTEQAKRSVLAHEVKIGTNYASSAAMLIELDDNDIPKEVITVKNKKPYVSRGGLKLKKAIDEFKINVDKKRCLDLGSSTGGFTDCLLDYGASDVTCVDVCYGQLAWQLRCNDKVKVYEQTNIKDVDPKAIHAPFDIVVADLSFISLASLANVISKFCSEGTIFVGLVKPQFESKHNETEKGVVKSDDVRKRTVNEVKDSFEKFNFVYYGYVKSPIKGRAGNIEYLIYMKFK